MALGFLERIGVDFFSTFAPMASLTSVRTGIAIAVHHGLPIYHADVPQAVCHRGILAIGYGNGSIPAFTEGR